MLDRAMALLEGAGRLNDEYQGGYTGGSLAAVECVDTDEGQALLNTYMSGAGQISAAMDFFAGMIHLCRPRIHRYAVFVTGRAALEASSRAWWLLADQQTKEVRIQRGFGERCRGLQERLRMEQALGQTGMSAKRRMAELRRSARSLGLQGRLRLPPDITRLMADSFNAAGLSHEEGVFAMKQLSAYVHGVSWALYAQTVDTQDEIEDSSDQRLTLRTPTINYGELAYTIDSVANVFALAFTSQVGVFGWDESRWLNEWAEARRSLASATAHILESEIT